MVSFLELTHQHSQMMQILRILQFLQLLSQLANSCVLIHDGVEGSLLDLV